MIRFYYTISYKRAKMGLPITFFFSTGKIWEECNNIWSQDIREYISEPWNLLDFSILTIFMTSFTARLMAFWHAYSAQCYIDKHHTSLSNMTLPFEIQYFQLGKCRPKKFKCCWYYG